MGKMQGLSCLRRVNQFFKIFLLTCLLALAGTSVSHAVPTDQLPNGSWGGIRWHHTNVSGWSKTATMTSVSISGGTILFPYNGGDWPAKTVFGTALSGNVWAIINYGGQWQAFTWDFLRPGQAAKHSHAIAEAAAEEGLHWHPHNGEEIYIFVSGLARTSDRNALERSNVVRYYWNSGTGTPGAEERPSCNAPPKIHYFNASDLVIRSKRAFLAWKIADADWAGLFGTDGYEKIIPTGPVVEGKGSFIAEETVTLTMRAKNECGQVSKSETVRVIAGNPWVSALLLNPKPVVVTGSAPYSTISGKSAKVTGTVDPVQRKATVTFQYGLTTKYGKSSKPVVVSGEGVKSVGPTLYGLTPGKKYHYRIKAQRGTRVAYGADRTFTTDNVPYPVTDGVTFHSSNAGIVTLKGKVNPRGAATSVIFRYGTTASTTSSLSGSALADPDAWTNQASSVQATGLIHDKKYYYKICAKNNVGSEQCGAVKTFVTFAKPYVDAVPVNIATITDTNATLRGSVDPNRSSATVTYEWWVKDPKGPVQSASASSISGDGFKASSYLIPVSSLQRGTTYEYRVIATNAYGTTTGSTLEFTTDDQPVVTTDSYLLVDSDTQTYLLKGTVLPMGAETAAGFQYGGMPLSGNCAETIWTDNPRALESPIAYDIASSVTTYLKEYATIGVIYCFRAWADNGIGGDGEPNYPTRVYGDPMNFPIP